MFSLASLDEQWSSVWHQTSHEDTHTEPQDVAHEAQTVAELVQKSDGLAEMVIVTAKKKKEKKTREGQSSKK